MSATAIADDGRVVSAAEALGLELPPMPPISLAYPRTLTDLRNAVGSNLVLGTVDGQRWATNHYWMTPAERLAALELDELPDGAYLADGKAWRPVEGVDYAGLLARFLNPATYLEPVTLLEAHGRPALVALAVGPDKVVDERLVVPFHEAAGLNARYLRLVTELEALSRPYGDVYGPVRLRQQTGAGDGAGRPVGVFAEVQHRRGGHRDPNAEGYVWIPETLEPAGERLIGVIMPVRLEVTA